MIEAQEHEIAKLQNEKTFLLDKSDFYIKEYQRAQELNQYLAINLNANIDFTDMDVKLNGISLDQPYDQILDQLRSNADGYNDKYNEVFPEENFFVVSGEIILSIKNQDFQVNEHDIDELIDFAYTCLVPYFEPAYGIDCRFLPSEYVLLGFQYSYEFSGEIIIVVTKHEVFNE